MAPGTRQNYARTRTKSAYAAPPTTIPPSMPLSTKPDPMPPSSRYLHNLRVIQRHDPTITSLFDQFPHVCLYHHKGDGWQKKGVEGAMFLFEREQEPKYGFYILNRNNTGDYIQRMTPDDDVEFANAYVIYRAFGKATSDTIGLWTMVTQDREAMSEVMMRLHGYIKRGEQYPDIYRRRAETWSTTPSASHTLAGTQSIPRSVSAQNGATDDGSAAALTNLLAKLDGSTSTLQGTVQPPLRSGSESVPPLATGIPLLDSIFASASQDAPAKEEGSAMPTTLQVLFASAANGVANGHVSDSTSSAVTPTQHRTGLPYEPTPSKNRQGHREANAAPRGIIPMGLAKGKPTAVTESARSTPGPQKVAPNGVPQAKRSVSYQHTVPPAQTNGVDHGGDTAGGPVSSPRKSTRNAKRRERRQRAAAAAANDEGPLDNGVEWPLVDDRSLSVDEEHDEEHSGLGDGLASAIAVLSAAASEPTTSPPPKKTRNRKRKNKEERQASSRADDAGFVNPSPSPSPHPGDVRNVVLEIYGQRRRVADSVLSEESLKAELLDLINNDPTFMRDVYNEYLMKVQL